MPQSTRFSTVGATTLAATGWLGWLATQRLASRGGDAFAAYYPVAQALVAGHGWESFAPLWKGAGRMPGYPILLALASLVTPDLIRATQLVGLLSALVVLGVLGGVMSRFRWGGLALLPAVALTATNPVFVRAALESMPDMAFCAALAVMLSLVIREGGDTEAGRGRAFWAGVAGGAALLLRFNAIALLPGGLAAVALGRRKGRLRQAGAFGVGFLVAATPILGPTLVLQARGISYPHLYITGANLGLQRSSVGIGGMVTALLRGAGAYPERLASLAPWPLLVAGTVVLVAWALRSPRAGRRLLAVVAAMALLLFPLHWEARYHLYLIPLLVGAGCFGLVWLAHHLRGGGAVASILVAGGLVLSAVQGVHSLQQVTAAAVADAADRDLCFALAAKPSGQEAPLLVGVPEREYWYSRLRECPLPRIVPAATILVPAAPEDRGLDRWLTREEQVGPTSLEKIATVNGWQLYRHRDELLATGAEEPALLPGITPWQVALPRRPYRQCERRTIDLAPGRYRVRALLRATAPLAARLEVRSGADRAVLWGAGVASPVVADLVVRSPAVELSLCAGDPLRSPGEVELRSLTVERIAAASSP